MRTTGTRTNLRAALAQTLIWLLIAPPAFANPSGHEVVAGDATVVVPADDPTHTTIHAADNSIINWQNFDIGEHESVQFIQPHELARVLNRVVGPYSTQIDGRLSANGIVYILNPYGVFFGKTAIIDVGELIAVAGNMSNSDFLGGIDRFTELGGRVENWGEISAGNVGLFGASVANHGLISAPDGAIWLIAGDEVVVAQHGSPVVVRIGLPDPDALALAQAGAAAMDGYAVENTGSLHAERGSVRMAAGDLLSLAVRNSGTIRAAQIELDAGREGRVRVAGTLDATNTEGVGGSIEIRGDLVALEGATVDASGRAGGGRIHIGGGWQGEHAEDERNARITWVDGDSVVRADALESGDGGEIVVWSDSLAFVHGDLSARGGETGGDGGRIETSGKRWIDLRSAPDVSAPAGEAGLWLLDPSNLTIVDVLPPLADPAQDLSDELSESTRDQENRIAPTVDNSFVRVSVIAEVLAQGAIVSLSTQNEVGSNTVEAGDITWEPDAILDLNDPTIQAGTTAILKLRAANNILIGQDLMPITLSDQLSNLDLTIEFVAGDPIQPASSLDIVDGGNIQIYGDINVDGGIALFANRVEVDGALTATRFGADPNAQQSTASAVLISSNERGIQANSITAGTGHITLLSNNGDFEQANADVVVDGDIKALGGGLQISALAGDITVNGDITTCDDCTISGLDSTPVVDIDVGVLADNASAATKYRDGEVRLNGSVSAGTGAVDVIARRITTNDITTQTGAVLLTSFDFEATDEGANAVAADPAPPAPGIDLNGLVTTGGGNVNIEGGGTVTLNADIDATGDDSSFVAIRASEDLLVEDVEIRAGEVVDLKAGTGGRGDLVFNGVAPRVEADVVRLQAGDFYTVGKLESDPTLSKIEFGAAAFSAAGGTALTELEILQDASIDALDVLANVVLDPLGATELRIGSLDGALTIGAAAAARISGANNSASLEAARARDDASGAALKLEGMLTLKKLDVTIAEDFVLDAADFSDHVNGSVDEMTVTTGTRAQAAIDPDPDVMGEANETAEVFGGLRVLADLTGFDQLTLHAGANGRGDLTIGDAAMGMAANLSATELTVRAGDGVGGAATSVVTLDSGTLTADDFSMRQDAAIGGIAGTGSSIPVVAELGAPAPARYELRSDDSSVTLLETDRSKLEDRALVIAGSSLSTPQEFITTPLNVHSLDVGGIGAFTVNNTLLDAFALTGPAGERSLTVRGGIGLNGNLTITGGTLFEGDTIRLVASDGPGGIVGNAIIGAATSSVRYQKPGASDAPDVFVFEQDAALSQSALPQKSQFGAEGSNSLPTTLGIRSHAGLQLSDLATLPIETGKLVLGGDFVAITDVGNIQFTLPTEFRADLIDLRAEGVGAFIDPNLQPITYAAHSTGEGEIDAGDFLSDPVAPGEGVPKDVFIRQDADLDGTNLASDPFGGPGGRMDAAETKTRYELQSISGSLSLDDGDRIKVRGTNLVLLASRDVGKTGTIDLSTAGTPFEVERLTIDQPRGLSFANAFEVEAQDLIAITAGTEGGAGQDLVFANGTRLRANLVFVRAGEDVAVLLTDLTADDLAVIEMSGLTVELTGENSTLELRQDGSFEVGDLPTFALDPTMVDRVTIESRRGNVTLDLATDQLELGKLVQVQSGTILHVLPDETIFGGLLTLQLQSTSLEDSLPAVEVLELLAPNVVLSAPADGTSRVLARSNADPLDPFTVRFATGIQSVTFAQDGQFDAGTDVASSELVQVDQFSTPDPNLIQYIMKSRRTGDFEIDPNFAAQLAIFDVTVETGVEAQIGDALGSVTITADTDPAATTPSPRFTGFAATADQIVFDTSRFDTDQSQRYAGTTTLVQNTTLGAGALGDISFIGTVDGDGVSPRSLTVQAGRNIQFDGDVGTVAALDNLTVQFAGSQATVEFGSEGGPSDSTVIVDKTLTIESINPAAYLEDRSATPLPVVRAPALDRASIFKRGTLHVDATDVLVGAGEKWTTLGTLDINATGKVQVGDLTADRVEIGDASSMADEIVVMLRGPSNVGRSDGKVDRDAGVDWVANAFELYASNGVSLAGAGSSPVVGTPSGQRLGVNTSLGFETLPFSSAAIYPDGRLLSSSDMLFVNADGDSFVLDMHPTGPSSTDFSRVLTTPLPRPSTRAPTKGPRSDQLVFPDVGIEAREPDSRESISRQLGAGIYDDASRAWRESYAIARVAAPRLDGENAAESNALFVDLFGADMEHADAIRTTLGRVVADYRDHTGARRVLGFELRRFVRNRPSTQFEGYQLLEKLDRLFSVHRRSGLVPGEYRPIQQAWVEAVTPDGIGSGELAQAIHPSRYVRGSDVLDVFGD